MNICLENIGIVKRSEIIVDGLTVIAGKNNSGKTTVGKVLYSLIDAVSNLNDKVRSDRKSYVAKQLELIGSTLRLLSIAKRAYYQYDETMLPKNTALYRLFHDHYAHHEENVEVLARELYEELKELHYSTLDLPKDILKLMSIMSDEPNEEKEIVNKLNDQIALAIRMLEKVFEDLEKDPELIQYAKESLEQTLLAEFNMQIQPVNNPDVESKVTVTEHGHVCFSIPIKNNKIDSDNERVYFMSPAERAYLIDDPYVFDKATRYRSASRNGYSGIESVFDMDHLMTHTEKLRRTLRSKPNITLLEMTIIEEEVRSVKEKLSSVLPGQFEFSTEGDFYVNEGKKLNISNLATGSKMFSIIKVLLDKGTLNRDTVLILDEPEAHLHPQWQNSFAEIIVLLAKELGLRILLTTHSPNFMLALDAYMRKYEFAKQTNFYQTVADEDGLVEYQCVNDNLELIYADFLQYLSDVKLLRDSYLLGTGEDE